MTNRWIWLVLASSLVACGSHLHSRRGGWTEAQIAALPADIQSGYEVFAVRCSRCHTLSRPLSADISDPEHWQRYVARMRRMPGAGISGPDAEQILVFLTHHAQGVAARKAKGQWITPRLGEPPEGAP